MTNFALNIFSRTNAIKVKGLLKDYYNYPHGGQQHTIGDANTNCMWERRMTWEGDGDVWSPCYMNQGTKLY